MTLPQCRTLERGIWRTDGLGPTGLTTLQFEPSELRQLPTPETRVDEISQQSSATPHTTGLDRLTPCLVFGLARSEGQMLAELLASDFCTRPQLFVAANRDNPKVALASIRIIISFMRKKLAKRHVKISALPNLGYGLNKQSRDRINQLLAEFDAGFLPSKSQAPPPKRRARTDQELHTD